MKIIGTEIMFGATLEAKTMFDETRYGFAIIPVDDEKAYLVNGFDNESYSGDSKAFVHYNAVKTDSIIKLNNSIPLFTEDEEMEGDFSLEEPTRESYGPVAKEYTGINLETGETVNGIAAFEIDADKSVIIIDFEEDMFSDNRPGLSNYALIKTNSLVISEVEKSDKRKLIKKK